MRKVKQNLQPVGVGEPLRGRERVGGSQSDRGPASRASPQCLKGAREIGAGGSESEGGTGPAVFVGDWGPHKGPPKGPPRVTVSGYEVISRHHFRNLEPSKLDAITRDICARLELRAAFLFAGWLT